MTNPKALADAMQQHDADSILLREMQQSLRAELAKPPESQNLDAIDELTAAICEMGGLEQSVAEHSAAGLEAFRKQLSGAQPESPAAPAITVSGRAARRHQIRWQRFAALAASLAGALCIANFATRIALGTGIFTAGAQLFRGGIQLTMSDSEPIPAEEMPVQNDQRGMRSFCEKYGFSPLVPQYLPDDYEPTAEPRYDENEQEQDVYFWYGKDDEHLMIQFTHYTVDDPYTTFGIPTQEYSMTDRQIGCTTIHEVEEPDYYAAAFLSGGISYFVSGSNIRQEVCEQIVDSFFADCSE